MPQKCNKKWQAPSEVRNFNIFISSSSYKTTAIFVSIFWAENEGDMFLRNVRTTFKTMRRHNPEDHDPHDATEWLALLLRIRGISGSNPDRKTDYPD
jgi:hypothetical protein